VNEKTDTLRKMQERVTAIIEEEYSELKGKFECKRCGKKILSNFALLLSLYFIPPETEEGVLGAVEKDLQELLKGRDGEESQETHGR